MPKQLVFGLMSDGKTKRAIHVDKDGNVILAQEVGVWQQTTIDITRDTNDSFPINLGRSYQYLDIIIPTITSSNLAIKVSRKLSGASYTQLGGSSNVVVAGTGDYADTWNLHGWRFILITSITNQGADRIFWVRGRSG